MASKEDIKLYKQYQKSPILFIKNMWDKTPERDNDKFIKEKHFSWQQHDILLAVEKAINGEAPKRISVASGHGCGKTCVLSWILLWYLFCHYEAQIGCTAPTADQIYDVLWKELSVWINKMPKDIADLYEWQGSYIRIRERPETWWARAKTARKENPEAIAGLHGENVALIVDEASGVPQVIFNTAEGSLTEENTLVILTGNPIRSEGYFYDTHHRDKVNWQIMEFSCIDSPIVKPGYADRIANKHGEDSDEYRFRVLGKFPKEGGVDDKNYAPLLLEKDLQFTNDPELIGEKRMGVDPAGEGSNKTVGVARDSFKAKIVFREELSNPKSVAEKILTGLLAEEVSEDKTWVDNFGIGANVAVETAKAGVFINPVNVGAPSKSEQKARMPGQIDYSDVKEDNLFINKKAEAFWRLRQWIKKGGLLVGNIDNWRSLLDIKFKRTLNGRIKIKGKEEMRKDGVVSPDEADAFMLTFVEEDTPDESFERVEGKRIERKERVKKTIKNRFI